MINHNFDNLTWLTAMPGPSLQNSNHQFFLKLLQTGVQDFSFKVQLLKVLLLHVYVLRTTTTADQFSRVLLTAIGTWQRYLESQNEVPADLVNQLQPAGGYNSHQPLLQIRSNVLLLIYTLNFWRSEIPQYFNRYIL